MPIPRSCLYFRSLVSAPGGCSRPPKAFARLPRPFAPIRPVTTARIAQMTGSRTDCRVCLDQSEARATPVKHVDVIFGRHDSPQHRGDALDGKVQHGVADVTRTPRRKPEHDDYPVA
jgi:hypothetical protein